VTTGQFVAAWYLTGFAITLAGDTAIRRVLHRKGNG
jgi:hypothetical protein